MAWTDAYTVRVHSTYDTVEMLNVFQVERVSVEIAAGDIREAYIDSIIPKWRDLTMNSCTVTTIDVLSLSDPEDFEIGFPVNIAGNGNDSPGPAIVAASIRFNRTRRDVRHGYTRFGGLSEGSYTANTFVAGFMAELLTNANNLLATWQKLTPDVPACNLMVVKRVFVPASGTHKEYYRLPENSGEYVAYRPSTAYLNPRVTSQVSRKRAS